MRVMQIGARYLGNCGEEHRSGDTPFITYRGSLSIYKGGADRHHTFQIISLAGMNLRYRGVRHTINEEHLKYLIPFSVKHYLTLCV